MSLNDENNKIICKGRPSNDLGKDTGIKFGFKLYESAHIPLRSDVFEFY